MDQEVRHLLEENLKLSKENNELLIKVRNVQRWQQITKIFYWIVIIAVSLGALYYLKPLLGNLTNLYTGGVSGINNISDITKNLSDQDQINNLLKELNK